MRPMTESDLRKVLEEVWQGGGKPRRAWILGYFVDIGERRPVPPTSKLFSHKG